MPRFDLYEDGDLFYYNCQRPNSIGGLFPPPCPPPFSPRRCCCCVGPQGPTGAAGASILGSYATYAEFIQAHPTGTQGDAYLVNGQLYVWNSANGTWMNMGSLVGPTGPAGPIGVITGSVDSIEELPEIGQPGDAYLVNGVLYVWDPESGAWTPVGNLVGPTGATATMIYAQPFR